MTIDDLVERVCLGSMAVGGDSIRLPGWGVSAEQNERGGWFPGSGMVTEVVDGRCKGRSDDSKAGSAFGFAPGPDDSVVWGVLIWRALISEMASEMGCGGQLSGFDGELRVAGEGRWGFWVWVCWLVGAIDGGGLET